MLEYIAQSESSDSFDTTSRRRFLRDVSIVGTGILIPGLASAHPQNPGLEKRVENFIKKLRKEGRIEADEKTAWAVYDFTSNQKLVSINEELPFQSASMVKPLIALALFHEVKDGRLSYDRASKAMLKASIQASNNPATNWLIDKIGGPERVQTILQQNYGHIFKNTHIVETIPDDGATYKNKASARDYSRFLYALWNNRLPYSEELKRLMALQKRDRIYDGTKVPEGTIVIDKTGSTGRLCGDMGVLVVKDRNSKLYPYTVVGIIQKDSKVDDYTKWIKSRGDVIREISNIVYDHMKARHKL